MINAQPVLSVVVPVYNEADVVPLFYSRLSKALKDLALEHEIIFVNDGSTDGTLEKLKELRKGDLSLKILDLSRNFGKEAALTAGLDYSSGSAVIPIDADLQDPPELIPELVAKWREGYDIVCATRIRRKGESWLKKNTAAVFYKLFGRIASIEIARDAGDFRLLSRPVVQALKTMRERHRFMKGLFSWVGFRQAKIFFERDPRGAGKTKWSYWKLWNFGLEGITSFSLLPLQAATYIGLFVSLSAFLYTLFIIVFKLVRGIDVPGYASLMVVVLFLGGVQLFTLGILGEYIGRTYDESKRRPLYIIGNKHGFEEE